jgi:DNA-binding NarL/FixJ family response regulator
MIRIVVVDSQNEFRKSVVNLLSSQNDFDVVGVGRDGFDALKLIETLKPDLAILELELPMLSALKVCPSAKIRSPETDVIILASSVSDETILGVVKNELAGYMLRSSVKDEICVAVHSIAEGGYHMSRDIISRMIKLFGEFVQNEPSVVPKLSIDGEKELDPILINKIELKIARCIGLGRSNRQIAEDLDLKEGTVRNYISVILQKTGLQHRTQIAIYAFNNGFADGSDVFKRDALLPKKKRKLKHPENQTCVNAAERKVV